MLIKDYLTSEKKNISNNNNYGFKQNNKVENFLIKDI